MGTPLIATPADRDSGLKDSIDEVDSAKAKEWAKQNVESTRKHLQSFWKSI